MRDRTSIGNHESVRSRLRAQRAIDALPPAQLGTAAIERLRLLKTIDELNRAAIDTETAIREFDAITERLGQRAA